MSFKTTIASGVFWNLASRIAQEASRFLTVLILARMLSPNEFGLLSMALVVTGFVGVMKNLGLGASIIQDHKVDQPQLSSMFWLNFLFSIFLGAAVVICAPVMSRFYHQPVVGRIMIVLSINLPLGALGMVHYALLNKRMDFKRIAIIRNASTLIGSVSGISMAFWGLGVWALVWSQLATNIVSTVLQWIVVPWRPSVVFSYRAIKKQLKFGVNSQLAVLLHYAATNVDDLLIGRALGPRVLGAYHMAYRLMVLPLEKISAVIAQVMLPALSSIQDNKAHVKELFLRVVGTIALVTFPMSLGAWVVADDAVFAFLGDKWEGVVPIFKVLCILGMAQSVGTSSGWILFSQGRMDLELKLQFGLCSFQIASFFVGIRWGAIGVATAYTIVSLVLMPFQFLIAGALINMRLSDMMKALRHAFCCAVMMSICVWSIGKVLPSDWPTLTHFAVKVAAGAVIYGLLIRLLGVPAYKDLKQTLKEQFGNGSEQNRRGGECQDQPKALSDE